MVLCPENISSEKPFKLPYFLERFAKSGLVFLVIYLVYIIESGSVTNTLITSFGLIYIIIPSEQSTVIKLDAICTTSVERDVLITSMSYDTRLIISPV